MNSVFNNPNFNGSTFSGTNTSNNVQNALGGKGVFFDGFCLTSLPCGSEKAGIMVQSVNMFDLDNIELTSASSTYEDGSTTLAKRYANKTIKLTLFINGSDYNDLVHRIDMLKQNTQKKDADLDLWVDNAVRRYSATLSGFVVPNFPRTENFVEGVELTFTVTSPHWRSPSPHQVALQGITGNVKKVVQNKGTYQVYPKVFIVFKETSNVTRLTISHAKIGQDTVPYTISIAHTFVAGSVLEIDYNNKVIFKDGEAIPFSGIMMPLPTGQTNYDFTFEWTVVANIFILYDPTFL